MAEQTGQEEALRSAWDAAVALPLDVAIMESATDMLVLPVDIGWSDVGSWSALFDVLPRDAAGNYGKHWNQVGACNFPPAVIRWCLARQRGRSWRSVSATWSSSRPKMRCWSVTATSSGGARHRAAVGSEQWNL